MRAGSDDHGEGDADGDVGRANGLDAGDGIALGVAVGSEFGFALGSATGALGLGLAIGRGLGIALGTALGVGGPRPSAPERRAELVVRRERPSRETLTSRTEHVQYMQRSDTSVSRRRFLAGAGTALAGGLAAAGGDPDTDEQSVSTTSARGDHFDEETVERARSVGRSLRPSVVAIERADGTIAGTGWYLAADDLVATAAHVLEDQGSQGAWLPDGTAVSLEPVGSAGDGEADVAAARADETASPLSVAPGDPSPGQPLVQVGNPRDVGYWTIALGRFVEADPDRGTFRTTLPAAGGFSGGPTATLAGEVVGLLAGSDPVHQRPLGEMEPEPPTPYGPDDRLFHARHEPADVVVDLVEGWTG